MADRLYIGIDSGTQGTKGVILSEKTGNIVAQSYHTYELIENDRGGREQNPESWIQACQNVLIDILAHEDVNPLDVKAIGVSGQQHGMVPLDSNNQVIRPAKLWCDTETAEQCRTITQRVGGAEAVFEKIGNQIAAGFTASKILWLQEQEPENYAKLASILLPHDYINFWLTGEKCTEFGDASGTAYFDIINRSWSKEVLSAIDASGRLEQCLPNLKESSEPIGNIRSEIVKRFGFSKNVAVSTGGGDNMLAAIGTGNVVEGIVTASLGTSGTIYAFSNRPIVDKMGELAAFCSSTGGWLPLVCTMNVTVATELVRNLFKLDLQEMNLLAAAVDPGAGGLILLPYFNGERTPALPLAKATLTGMDSLNMSADMICRAAMEGATLGLRYGLDVIKRNGIVPKEIRLTGGGSKSSLWRQILADIFNCEVVCLTQEEAGATGAALQALWCAKNTGNGNVSIEEVTRRYVTLDETSRLQPQPAIVSVYESIYQNYLTRNKALSSVY